MMTDRTRYRDCVVIKVNESILTRGKLSTDV